MSPEGQVSLQGQGHRRCLHIFPARNLLPLQHQTVGLLQLSFQRFAVQVLCSGAALPDGLGGKAGSHLAAAVPAQTVCQHENSPSILKAAADAVLVIRTSSLVGIGVIGNFHHASISR